MQLPFTHDQFLDLFADYNVALWPAAALLWLATLAALWRVYRRRPNASRVMAGLLAFHWAWAGAVYQLGFFRRINPAAALFGIAFLLEAALLAWRGGIRRQLDLTPSRSLWSRLGTALIICAMLYPAAGLVFGLQYPRLPLFGVPCPTTILTAGVLLLGPRREARILGWIPVLWAGVGSSAAFGLGIRADLAMILAGILLLGFLLVPGGAPERRPVRAIVVP